MAKMTLTEFKRDEEKNEYEISCDQLKSMLTDNIHHMSYYHLTTWPSLCKMMEHVTVPDDGTKHRMLHLSAAVNMNDRDDKKCGNGVYFSSFSFGPAENISMWTNYGIPNEEAVRVRFYYSVFIKWIQTLRHSIKVYGVNPDGSLTSLSAKPEIKLVDVAYWSQDKRQGRYNDPNEGIFIHDRNKFRLQKCTDVQSFMREEPYMFKEAGWNYESETRLVLKFKEELAVQYSRVAIPFDGPLDNLDEHFSTEVIRGPWFTPGKDLPKAAGHSLEDAGLSVYTEKVKMRSVCDNCPELNSDNCKCKFKGQR